MKQHTIIQFRIIMYTGRSKAPRAFRDKSCAMAYETKLSVQLIAVHGVPTKEVN